MLEVDVGLVGLGEESKGERVTEKRVLGGRRDGQGERWRELGMEEEVGFG